MVGMDATVALAALRAYWDARRAGTPGGMALKAARRMVDAAYPAGADRDACWQYVLRQTGSR